MASVHSLGGPGAHAEKGKAFGRRRAPPCGDTATDQEWGEGRPGQLWAPSTIDPGQSDGGFHLQGLLPQSALQVLRDKVGLVMLGEVVTPHEALLTLGTLKALVACVGSSMSLELIAPREPLPTEEPVADKGSLAGV